MLIKRYSSKFGLKKLIKIQFILIATGLLILFVFYMGILFRQSGLIGLYIKPAIVNAYRIPINYLKGTLSNIDRATIDIKFTDLQDLLKKK